MNRGLKSSEHDMFKFTIKSQANINELIVDLHEEYGTRFEVFFEDIPQNKLRRETIIIINGMNMVAREGLNTRLSEGDLIVFMIAAVGG